MGITKKFMDWYQGNNDTEKESPKGGMKRVGYIIWNYAGKLTAVNVMFLLCSLPVVTMPAAIAAMNRYLSKIFRVGYGFGFEDFWKEFKGGIRRNLFPGILTGGLFFYAYYLLSLAGNFRQAPEHDIVTGIGLAVLALAVCTGSYSFVLSAMLDLPAKHILKNTLILIFAEWKTSLLLVVETFFYWGLMLALVPFSLFFLLVIGIALQQLFVYAMIDPVVERRIIKPYEQKNSQTI